MFTSACFRRQRELKCGSGEGDTLDELEASELDEELGASELDEELGASELEEELGASELEEELGASELVAGELVDVGSDELVGSGSNGAQESSLESDFSLELGSFTKHPLVSRRLFSSADPMTASTLT